MLKKYEKIIKSVLNPKFSQAAKMGYEGGFFYIMDGYRIVRFEDAINDIPMFKDGEKQYNYAYSYYKASVQEYDTIEIPYTTQQIKAWIKKTKKIHKDTRVPFKLGVCIRPAFTPMWIGVNPKFIIDAMETTKSNIIHIPRKGQMLLMQGNGLTWLIMPIWLHGYECDKHMTEIETEDKI